MFQMFYRGFMYLKSSPNRIKDVVGYMVRIFFGKILSNSILEVVNLINGIDFKGEFNGMNIRNF